MTKVRNLERKTIILNLKGHLLDFHFRRNELTFESQRILLLSEFVFKNFFKQNDFFRISENTSRNCNRKIVF